MTGAQFEILVDGKPRSYRDTQAAAAAQYLKSKHPHSEIAVKDMQSGERSPAFVRRKQTTDQSEAGLCLPLLEIQMFGLAIGRAFQRSASARSAVGWSFARYVSLLRAKAQYEVAHEGPTSSCEVTLVG